MCAAAAAGPAVEGWVAHVCRLPDAEACSVLGARSMSLSLSPDTHASAHTHAHTPMAVAHTLLVACITRLGGKKREGERGREGGWQRGNGQKGGGNQRLQREKGKNKRRR